MEKVMISMQQQMAGLQRSNDGMLPIFQQAAEMQASAPVQRAAAGITPAEDEYVAKKRQTDTGCEITEVVQMVWG